MTKAPEELLAVRIGATSVEENLHRAIESGRLIENGDGTLQIAGDPRRELNWMYVSHGPSLGCGFLMGFMFHHAYAEAAVPNGCSGCYKVKVVLRTLRELVAAWAVAKRIQCKSKWGTDLNNVYSQNIYAGYFYVSGLDGARALFKVVRDLAAPAENLYQCAMSDWQYPLRISNIRQYSWDSAFGGPMIIDSDRKSFGDTASDRSELAGKTPSLKTWVTPKVITSAMEDAEAGAGATSDAGVHS